MSKAERGYHSSHSASTHDFVTRQHEYENQPYTSTSTVPNKLIMNTLDSLLSVSQEPQLYNDHYQFGYNERNHQFECQENVNSPYNCTSQDFELNEMLDFNPRDVNFSDLQRLWFRKDTLDILFRIAFVAPILLLGIAGNLTIIYSMCKFKPFRTKPTNIFILNMAIADLLTTMVCPIAALVTDIYQFYVLGSFLCRFEGFIKITCLLVKSYSLIVLSCEWLLCVVRPCRTRITIKQSWLALTIIWILSVVMASPLFVWRKLRQRMWKDLLEVWCCELIQYTKYYWVVINFFLIYLPTFFMTIVLIIILIKMDKFEAKLKRTRNTSNQGNLSINMKYRRRIVKILITYLLTSFICWTPFQFTIIYRHFRSDPIPASWFFELTFFAQLCASLTAAVNPIIFGFLSQPFRIVLTRLVMFKFLEKFIGFNTKSSENDHQPNNLDKIKNNNHHAMNHRKLNSHIYRQQKSEAHQAQAQTNYNPNTAQPRNLQGKRSSASHQNAPVTSKVNPVVVSSSKLAESDSRALGVNKLRQFLVKMPDMRRAPSSTYAMNGRLSNGAFENAAFIVTRDKTLIESSVNKKVNSTVPTTAITKYNLITGDGPKRTNTTSFMQREHNLYPSSFVSMDSINIEENLGTANVQDVDETT